MISNADIQTIIDDLDFAQVFFRDADDAWLSVEEQKKVREFDTTRRSLKAASDILTHLSDEAIERLPNWIRLEPESVATKEVRP